MTKRLDNYIKMLFIIIAAVLIIGLILINANISTGQEVISYKYANELVFGNAVGYEVEADKYKASGDTDHYLTYILEDGSEELLVIYDEPPAEGTEITVWCMTNEGDVLKEYTVIQGGSETGTVEEAGTVSEKRTDHVSAGSRFFRVTDIPEHTKLVSLGIDADFSLYAAVCSRSYRNAALKPVMASILILILAAVGFVFIKKRLLEKKLEALYDNIFATGDIWKSRFKNILKYVLILLGSILISFLAVWLLSSAGVTFAGLKSIGALPSGMPAGGFPVKLNIKTVVLLAVFIYSVYIIAEGIILKDKDITPRAVAIILLVGSAFCFLEPAGNGVSWDDEIHYKNSSNLSHIVDHRWSLADTEIYHYYQSVALERTLYTDSSETDNIYRLFNYLDREHYFKYYEKTGVGTVSFSYIHIALGMCLARGLGLPFTACIITGRWFNLLFLVVLVWLTMRKLKYGRIVAVLLMMIPTNMFMATSFSYDTWLTALSMYAFAIIFSERMEPDKEMKTGTGIILPVVAFAATIAKPVYFVLTTPALFIPKAKFGSKKKMLGYWAGIFVAAVLPFVFVMVNNVLNAGMGDTRGGSDVNATLQIQYILGNNLKFLKTITTFLAWYLNPVTGGEYWQNNVGYNGMFAGGTITLLLVVLGALINYQDSGRKTFPVWYRLCVILLYIGVGAICAVSMYISYTGVGADYVAGCQGRYLFPVLFPTLYVLTRIPIKKELVKPGILRVCNSCLLAGMMLINLLCLWSGCVGYY